MTTAYTRWTAPAMQRLIDSVNFEDEESMNWFHRTLRPLGRH